MSLMGCRKSHHTPATLAPAHTPYLFSIDLHIVRQHLVIARFCVLLLPSGTLVEMMSGVLHHCHHISLTLIFNCFIPFTNTEHPGYILAPLTQFVWLCILYSTVFFINFHNFMLRGALFVKGLCPLPRKTTLKKHYFIFHISHNFLFTNLSCFLL